MKVIKLIGAIVLLLICCASSSGQSQIVITGEVLDSSNLEHLPFATLILTHSTKKKQSTDFFQTDQHGNFQIRVNPREVFSLEVSFLGYNTKVESFSAIRDSNIIIKLSRRSTILDNIVVKDTFPPIIIRGDTIIYNTDYFNTGKERKLNDLINNLPGLSVDENEVSFNGESVETILVEGERFFGGSSELALKGIPADVVGRIEVIKDFNELGFSLNSGTDDQIAINIKLNPEKKNIYFGDISAGVGLVNRYQSKNNLFNYSHKKNVYVFSGLNNIDERLISLKESIRILGGGISLGDENIFDKLKDVTLKEPFQSNKSNSKFNAIGLQIRPSKSFKVNVYGVFSQQENEIEEASNTISSILNDTFRLEEFRDLSRLYENKFGVIRFESELILQKEEFLRTNVRFKSYTTDNNVVELYNNNFQEARASKNSHQDVNTGLTITNDYIKRYNNGNIHHATIFFEKINESIDFRLSSNAPFLERLIEWGRNTADYSVIQNKSSDYSKWTFQDKYSYRINSNVYLSLSGFFDRRNNSNNIGINRIDSNSDIELNQSQYGAKISGRILVGNWKINPTIKIGNYIWAWSGNVKSLFLFLPSFESEVTIPNVGILKLDLRSSLSRVKNMWFNSNPFITGFNSYYTGNNDLIPNVNNSLTFGLNKSNPILFSSWGISASYNVISKNNVIDEIDLIVEERNFTQVNTDRSSSSISFIGHYNRDYENFSLEGRLNVYSNLNLFSSIMNINYTRNSSALLITSIKYYVNDSWDFKFSNSISKVSFRNELDVNTTYNLTNEVNSVLKIKNFLFKSSIKSELYNLRKNPISLFNASQHIFYRKESSPWELELSSSIPFGGNSVFSVDQEEAFYQERVRSIFPWYTVITIRYNF